MNVTGGQVMNVTGGQVMNVMSEKKWTIRTSRSRPDPEFTFMT